MGERAVSIPVAAISPVQQMLASGTGALLTSVFGEILEAKPRNQLMSLKVCHVVLSFTLSNIYPYFQFIL